jgi:hypothetical protein
VTEDDGYAISYKVLKPGTVVKSADGVQLGTVRSVEEAKRELIFDGIVIDTGHGRKFIDAPEVARIAERAVTCTFDAADADKYMQEPRSSRSIMGGGLGRRLRRS